jgi:putative ATPase
MAINDAMEAIQQKGDQPVPLHLRNAPTKLMKDIGYGKDYQYSHGYENNFSSQEYLPDALKGMKFYEPGNNAREKELRDFLKKRWGDKYSY